RRSLIVTSASTALVVGCGDAATPVDVPPDDTPPGDTSSPEDPLDDTGTPTCDETGDDIEGPFWVEGVPIRNDLDLHGDPGPRLSFEGVVRDALTCVPLADAVVEIWHADPAGDYDGAADGKYRGQTRTDADGAYRFETLVPGRYLNGPQFRPAHVHVKVWVEGVERLTTQLYFANDPYNDDDPWFDPDRIVADLDDGDLVEGMFDLVV
ncbi:MAG: hypothetical protein AAF211_01650, partial [Myxococcota bacterium]